jgi:hypothetical protein
MESTFQGLKWYGDATSRGSSGFSQSRLAKRNEDLFTPLDRFRIQVIMYPKYVLWQYGIPSWYGSLCARLIVLPLLILPFKLDVLSAILIFSPSLRTERHILREATHSNTVRTGMNLSSLAVVEFVKERCKILGAWADCFSKPRQEVELV